MRELSTEATEQLRQQLERVGGGAAREAMIEAVFLVAAVDGKVTMLEIAQFTEAIEAILGGSPHEEVEATVKRLAARLEEDGWEKRVASIRQALADSDQAEATYRMAAAVAFVDDTIEHAEAAALDSIAGALGIPYDRAHALMGEVRSELFAD